MADETKTTALSADAKKHLAASKRRGNALVALIERRKDRITEDFYDIGEALRELLNSKLYVAMGHESFDAMLDARKVMSPSQAFKLIRLVDSIPRDFSAGFSVIHFGRGNGSTSAMDLDVAYVGEAAGS